KAIHRHSLPRRMTGHHKTDSKSLLLKLVTVITEYPIEMVEHGGMTRRIVGEVAGAGCCLDDPGQHLLRLIAVVDLDQAGNKGRPTRAADAERDVPGPHELLDLRPGAIEADRWRPAPKPRPAGDDVGQCVNGLRRERKRHSASLSPSKHGSARRRASSPSHSGPGSCQPRAP